MIPSMDDEMDLTALVAEQQVLYDGNPIAFSLTLLTTALPRAIRTIIELSEEAKTDRIRLQAATFIVDRVLPKPDATPAGKSPFERLLGSVVKELDAEAASRLDANGEPITDAVVITEGVDSRAEAT